MIKIMKLLGETKVAPRKTFVLFFVKFDEDELPEYILYFENDPYRNEVFAFDEDELDRPYLEMNFEATGDILSSLDKKAFDYILKKVKGLYGVEIDKNYRPDGSTMINIKIPTKYFEIKPND
jgi:hypothetical protein